MDFVIEVVLMSKGYTIKYYSYLATMRKAYKYVKT